MKFLLLSLTITLFVAFSTPAQSKEYFTPIEIELVREFQEIDLRLELLTKMIDRRMFVLDGPNSNISFSKKETERFGELPSGTTLELLRQISKILEKATDDVDGYAEKSDVNDKAFIKGMRRLAAYSEKLPAQLAKHLETSDEKQKGLITGIVEMCSEIVAARAKLPEEVDKRTKKN